MGGEREMMERGLGWVREDVKERKANVCGRGWVLEKSTNSEKNRN